MKERRITYGGSPFLLLIPIQRCQEPSPNEPTSQVYHVRWAISRLHLTGQAREAILASVTTTYPTIIIN